MIVLRDKSYSELKFKSSGVDGRPLEFKGKPDLLVEKKKVIVSPGEREEIIEQEMRDSDQYYYNPQTGEYEEIDRQ